MTEPTIICPNCKTEIRLTESLAAPLLAATRKQFEQQLAQKDDDIARREQGIREKEKQIAEDNLELFRRFYLEYPRLLPEGLPDQISDAPRRKSDGPAVALQIQHAVRAESWQALAIPVDSARRGAGECDAGCARGAICAGWRER